MSLHRATHDLGASSSPSPDGGQRLSVGPAALFIFAVLIAGMTCVLYLWQQSRIVAGQQDIVQLDAKLTLLTQQRDDLVAQAESLRSVRNIVAHAVQYGMQQPQVLHDKSIALQPLPPAHVVAQNPSPSQTSVILPATNAAITSWWQNAWDSLYNLLQ